jgi:toxin-antitoxin system PIN domain toxin
MLLADSNIWLALDWLSNREPQQALFCRCTQQSFLRLLTTRAVLAPYRIPPLTNKAAWSVCEGLRADGRIAWVEEPSGLEALWKNFAGGPKASPKLWMDAYLAAFAKAGGHQLVTTDKAFRQFKGLDCLVLSSHG